MRWVASLVAEAFRILTRGGIFMYPKDSKDATRPGRLRLMYEANPISFIIEQAGGKSTTGRERVMEMKPTELHQRVPLIFGSKNEVERVAATTPNMPAARSRIPSIRPCSQPARCSERRNNPASPPDWLASLQEAPMSVKHPIVAITGSSGAGTSTVTKSFDLVFRREKLKAAIVEGDSFHRYDRKAMKAADGRGARPGRQQPLQPLRPGSQPARGTGRPVQDYGETGRARSGSTCTTPKRRRPTASSRASSRPGKTSRPAPT
jgi:hypothetical protein